MERDKTKPVSKDKVKKPDMIPNSISLYYVDASKINENID